METLRAQAWQHGCSNDWCGLWTKLEELPPIIAIEALQWFPQEWCPEDPADRDFYQTLLTNCRSVYLADFEQLSRSPDEHVYFPLSVSSKCLLSTRDGNWIIQTTDAELRILYPDTMLPYAQFVFKRDDNNQAASPVRVAVNRD